MATYAIGDVQGCFDPLRRLFDKLDFDRDQDQLWFAGDLVNRGPASLEVLRWVYARRAFCTVVLGNHDFHLLMYAAGLRTKKRRDTLDEVLAAPDCDALVDWLAAQPLFVRRDEYVLVHAGLMPEWTLQDAADRARAVERALEHDRQRFLELLAKPDTASAEEQKLIETIAVMTRIRMLGPDGRPRSDHVGPPEAAPHDYVPWYAAGRRRPGTIVFGHWAGLGRRKLDGALALDSGCVWGRCLSAVRLEDGAVFEQRCTRP